jgi:hypothetical protein
MAEFRSGVTGLVLGIVAGSLLLGAAVTTALLWWLGDWEHHGFGLTLALRIVWGVTLLTGLASLLTRATMFGWYFRRYFGRADPAAPQAAEPLPTTPPWPKSGKASFSITLILVSLTGAALVATAVLWMLADVLGWLYLRLIVGLIWGAWWVLVIAAVLTRVAIFGTEKKRAIQANKEVESPSSPSEPPPET